MRSRIEAVRKRSWMPDRIRRMLAWQRGSLASAISLRVLLFGIGLGLAFSLVFFEAAQDHESQRLLENISGLVSTVEATARVACFTGDQTLAMDVAEGLLANRAVASVRITSGSRVLAEAHKRTDMAGRPLRGSMVSRKMNSPFNAADEVGEVVLVADDDYIREQAGRYSLIIVLTSMLEMLIVSLAVAWVVLRMIVRPIREFSDKLSKWDVESGDFVPYPKGNEFNEIGNLAYSFNNLLGHLFEQVRHEKAWREQLAHQERGFRTLAENSPNLIVRYDADFQRVYCNPAYYAMLGGSSGSVLNDMPEQVWWNANISAADFQCFLRRVMDTGASEKVLLEWTTEDGRLISNDFHLMPERDADERISSVLAIGHDISVLKRQQRIDKERSRVFERIVQGGELHTMLGMVAGYVESSFNAYQCAILLLDAGNRCLRIGSAPNLPGNFCSAVDRSELCLPPDCQAPDYWTGFGALAMRHGLMVCGHEPILDSRDRLLGMLTLYQAPSGGHGGIDANFLRQVCSLAAIAIERKRIEELVQHQASYDALTDLPNRRMFGNKLREEIARANRNGGNVTLLFIDLDRFKGVNDTLGHETGDKLLVEAAARICSCLREADTVARFGGDEFVVVIPDAADVSHLGRVARDIVEVMNAPFELGMNTAYVSASIGIASYPSDTDSADKLVSYADQAMYAAKDAGRNGFHFYSAELSTSANERLALELDLRQGIARNELELYYQPKIDLACGALIGSEALLRWNHPQRGLVMPDCFIGIAEDSGLIDEIGVWVLREGCRTASEWNGDDKPLHKVAINLSARQFQSGDLYMTVGAILAETGCYPEWIELEITESLLLEEGGSVLATLENFRNIGISIAIDDFGTGYSALSYLARFPINTLKIDRSFIMHVADGGYHAELVKAIISIANSLNQQVVAEGVETGEQADVLRAFGCHVAQGYLYGKPLRKHAFRSARPSGQEAIFE